MRKHKIRIACKTDTGRVRHNNEDSLFVDDQLGPLIVADGMGGHQGGEVASALAVDVISSFLKERLPDEQGTDQVGELIVKAIQKAHEEICTRAADNPELNGMGTTVVLALCQGEKVHVAHVGDSRAYLIRDNEVRQLTKDHSVVSEMLRSGQITPREARRHPLRNVITRSLGSPDSAGPDVQCHNWEQGDYLLICSDGLTNMVKDPEIKKLVLKHASDVQAACEALVAEANANGGKDNISVILAHRSE